MHRQMTNRHCWDLGLRQDRKGRGGRRPDLVFAMVSGVSYTAEARYERSWT
jgi:hypothetical protein